MASTTRLARGVLGGVGVLLIAAGLVLWGVMAVAYLDYRQALADGAVRVVGTVGDCTRYEIQSTKGPGFGLECTYTYEHDGRTGTTVVRDSVQTAPTQRDLLVLPETGEDVFDPRTWMVWILPVGLAGLLGGGLLVRQGLARGAAPPPDLPPGAARH